MKKDLAVQLTNISKVYKLYDKPIDRLKESLHPLKRKYHKEFYALKDINLEIKKGEVLGIVGVNGAGKSTLLKIISGVLTPTSGRVNIHGRINAILELGSSLKPEMTGRENIKLNLQINGIEKDRDKITQEIIEFADIGEHIDQPIKSYSSGMKARLGFAIATSTDPDILIVDEVLAVGDELFRKKCYNKMEKLLKDGKTVLYVSHNLMSVNNLCTKAILLYEREIVYSSIAKNVTHLYQEIISNKDKPINTIISNFEQKIKSFKVSQEEEGKDTVNRQNFSSKLIPKSTYELGDYNVKVKKINLKDTNGNIVNHLQFNEEYSIEFNVNIDEKNINKIYFGVGLGTSNGVFLSGIKSEQIDYGTNTICRIPFKCILIDGYFYITIAIRGINSNNEDILLKKIVDISVFKVNNNEINNTGIFHIFNNPILMEQ